MVDRTKGSWAIHGWSPMMVCVSGGDCPAAATGAMRQFVEQNRLAVYVATQGRTLPRAAWGVQYFRADTTRIPSGVFDLNMLLAAPADSRWPDPTRMWLMGEFKIANAWFMELERGRVVDYPSSEGSAGPIHWRIAR